MARESPRGFTPTLSNFKGTRKSWDMFPGTPLVLVPQLRSPPYPSRGPTSLRPAQGLGAAAEVSLAAPATLIPAHLGAHFHLSPLAHSPASLLPSPPASERHLHWVKANFNTLRPPAATCSLSICTISWSCGSEHPWSQSTQDLPAAWAIISSCPVKQGTVMVSLFLGHLHAGERMWLCG